MWTHALSAFRRILQLLPWPDSLEALISSKSNLTMAKVGLEHLLQKEVYADYLRRLDARALLDFYNAENQTEQTNKDGSTEIVHSCLLDRVEPHHTNGDANPSASCNIDKKTYVCYSMGFGCDLFHLVQKLEDQESFADALGVVGQFLTGSTQEVGTLDAEIAAAFANHDAYRIELPAYNDRILASWDKPHPYWDHRGISPAAQEMLRLGYDEREQRIVFPHFVKDTLVGWQKRVIPGQTTPPYPKYRNSSGFPKSETLYNLDVACNYSRVAVVESPMSVARAVSLGLHNVVATFGAKVNAQQIACLEDFHTVYVWFDDDPAGRHGEKKLVEHLYHHTDVRVVAPEGGRDMGDADLDEIASKLVSATPASLKLGEYDQDWRSSHG